MSKITWYLLRQNFYAFAFALVVVVCVVLLTQSFRMLSFVVENSATMLIFLKLMALMIPKFLPVLVPIALGVAILFTIYRMNADNEIVVMRAVGISPGAMVRPVLMLAVGVTLFGYCLTLWTTPTASRGLVTLQYYVRDNFSPMLLRAGTFNDLSEGLTFYARTRVSNVELRDILMHDVREPEHPVTIMADKGIVGVSDSGAPQIFVFNGRRQEIDPDTGKMSQLEFASYVVDLGLLKKEGDDRLEDPREQSITELLNPPADPQKRKTSLTRIDAELHQRLASPLLALGYAAMALLFMLAGEFNRRGAMRRIIAASLAMVAMQALVVSLENLMGKYDWIIPLYYAAIVLPIFASLGLILWPQRSGRELHPAPVA